MEPRTNVTVAFCIFNRPEPTARVFAEIARARPAKLLLIADGPREHQPADAKLCQETRSIVEHINWPCEVQRNYSETNLGLRRRMSSGLDWVFEQVEEAIVLEDDCLPDPSFFPYCCELLEKYRNDERVAIISGLNVLGEWKPEQSSYHFSHFAGIWGWAAWRRTWKNFDLAMQKWPEADEGGFLDQCIPEVDFRNEMRLAFQRAFDGRMNTWAYPFLFSRWLCGKIDILPSVNLVTNVGFAPGATNCTVANPFAEMQRRNLVFPLRHGPVICDDELDRRLRQTIPQVNPQRRSFTVWNRLVAWLREFVGRASNVVRRVMQRSI